MLHYFYTFLFLTLAAPAVLIGETFTREGAVARALKAHPQIQIAELEIARAQARMDGAGLLENPDFELSGSTDEFGNDEGESTLEIGFAQRFPLTKKLRHEKQLAEIGIGRAIIEVAAARLDIASQVDVAFTDVLAVREKVALRSEQAKLQSEIADQLAKRAESGEASSLDAAEPRLAAQLLKAEARSLTLSEQAALATLSQLLRLPPNQDIELSGSLDLPINPPPPSSDTNTFDHPDYQRAALATASSNHQILLANDARWDDVEVKIFAEHEHSVDAPEGRASNDFIGLGVSVPLPLWNRNEAGVAEAQIAHQQASLEVEKIGNDRLTEVAAAHARARLAHELAKEISGETFALAEENVNAIRKAQANGQVTPTDVQRALAQKLSIEQTRIELIAEFHRAAAGLRHATANYPGIWGAGITSKNPRP